VRGSRKVGYFGTQHPVEDQALPELWHAVVCGVQHLPTESIPGRLERVREAREGYGVVVPIRQTPDVLHKDRSRSSLANDPRELVKERGVRIVARSLVLEPVAGLAERRAGRPTNDECSLADAQASDRKDLVRRYFDDRPLDHSVLTVPEQVRP
jgi:hypothetical protein